MQLSKLYRDACRDLERERIAGRAAQEQCESIEKKLVDLEDSTARSAFVLVLIDADADAYLVSDSQLLVAFYRSSMANLPLLPSLTTSTIAPTRPTVASGRR